MSSPVTAVQLNKVMDQVRPPEDDEDVPAFCRALGVPGLADVHTHFLPPRMLRKVRGYFDRAGPLVGASWPIRYKWSDEERVAHLRGMGVRMFSALAYAHRPGMAADLNAWTMAFAQATPGCLPSATFYPEPGAGRYVRSAAEAGARVLKVHLQVGGFSPVDPLLDEVWENSVKGLTSSVSGGISGLQAQVSKIESDATALVNSAKSDFPSQTSAITSSVNALKSSVTALASNRSVAQLVVLWHSSPR